MSDTAPTVDEFRLAEALAERDNRINSLEQQLRDAALQYDQLAQRVGELTNTANKALKIAKWLDEYHTLEHGPRREYDKQGRIKRGGPQGG